MNSVFGDPSHSHRDAVRLIGGIGNFQVLLSASSAPTFAFTVLMLVSEQEFMLCPITVLYILFCICAVKSLKVKVTHMSSTKVKVVKSLILNVLKYKSTSKSKYYIYLRVYTVSSESTDYQPGRLSDLIFSIFLIIVVSVFFI